MKAVVLRGAGQFACEEICPPVIGPGELLLQLGRAAICGTDLRILEGKKTKDVRYPSVIGHEISGTVYQVGEGVSTFQKGDRVAVANVLPCGDCPSCLAGRSNACQARLAIGYQYDGGFAEYVRIPAAFLEHGNVFRLPETVSFETGALLEPLACCLRGQRNAGVSFLDTVLIVGAGPIGLMHLQLSLAAGARCVIVSEINGMRREKAQTLGAHMVIDPEREDLTERVREATGGAGVDRMILAIGAPAIVNGLLGIVRKGGTACLFAGFAGKGTCSIDANIIHYNEIHVCGSTAYTRQDYRDAAALAIGGKIDLESLATHCFPLEQFQEAYETCRSGAGLKIMIRR